ncbi:MAG: SAM-dependent chlorinase/fluorinase [Alphaproteobacteria bacterium]|jgi:S-adenosylmethionine hydrolase|nr:SAM-dependent chlorinase/fluorinase [Alphaproteobacteria bacterium]
MKKFIPLILIMFILGNINSLKAITVFDSPSATETAPAPVKPKAEPKKVEPKKTETKKVESKKPQSNNATRKSVEKKQEQKANKKPTKDTPKKGTTTKHTKVEPKKTTPENTPIVARNSKLPPLIIVNNFEEDPIFISAIKGVLYSVNKNLDIINVSNPSEPKNTIPQAYKLLKTAQYWGENAVFVSGSYKDKIETSIIVVKTKNNQFFVTQNSGVLTFIEDTVGIAEVREIQRVNFDSKTFNGRDVEYLIGAKLINDPNSFKTMGEPLNIEKLAKFSYTPLQVSSSSISSLFVVEDAENGDIFTFIKAKEFNKFKPKDNDVFNIVLSNGANIIAEFEAIYKNSLSYTGGNQAIILEYKSSIGSYIVLKNIQEKLPKDIGNYKIIITPAGKAQPIDVSNIVDTQTAVAEETPNSSSNVYPFMNNSNNITSSEESSNQTPTPTEPKNDTAQNSATSNVYPFTNKNDGTNADDTIAKDSSENSTTANTPATENSTISSSHSSYEEEVFIHVEE